MKLEIGIGDGTSFYVLKNRDFQMAFLDKKEEPEMFIWLTQYLLDQGHDPTKEHKWYEIEL